MGNETAFLIVDVQIGLIERGLANPDELLVRINQLASAARASQIPVIYIQHDGNSKSHPLHPDKSGWAIHPAIAPQENEPIIRKTVPDAFKDTTLSETLQNNGIRKLVVVGAQTEICINATCRAAARLGYDVTLASDAHSTFNKKKMTAQQIIDEYNRELGDSVVRLMLSSDIQFN